MKGETKRTTTTATSVEEGSLSDDRQQQQQQQQEKPSSLLVDEYEFSLGNNDINFRRIRSVNHLLLCGIFLHICFVLLGHNKRSEGGIDWVGRRALSVLDLQRLSGANVDERTIPGPIIIMGLPNSGSIALHRYFQCRGMGSRHYCCGVGDGEDDFENTQFPCRAPSKATATARTCGECVLNNMKERRAPFDGCHPGSTDSIQVWSSFDVETQEEWFLPQHFAIGLLQEAYPNATWILNRRSSPEVWAESIVHWHSKTRRLFASYHLPMYPHPVMSPPATDHRVSHKEILHDMNRVLLENIYNETDYIRKATLLQKLYRNHTQTIRAWAKQFPLKQQPQHRRRPQRKLWEINVDDDPATVLRTLDTAFPFGSEPREGDDNRNTNSLSCGWTYIAPDKDWENFKLPF